MYLDNDKFLRTVYFIPYRKIHPAVKAKSHTFFQNEWNEDGAIQEQGMFFNQFVKATDDEQPEFIVGKIYHINVTDMTKRSCVVMGEKE